MSMPSMTSPTDKDSRNKFDSKFVGFTYGGQTDILLTAIDFVINYMGPAAAERTRLDHKITQ